MTHPLEGVDRSVSGSHVGTLAREIKSWLCGRTSLAFIELHMLALTNLLASAFPETTTRPDNQIALRSLSSYSGGQ